MLKGHSVGKVGNHCCRAGTEILPTKRTAVSPSQSELPSYSQRAFGANSLARVWSPPLQSIRDQERGLLKI